MCNEKNWYKTKVVCQAVYAGDADYYDFQMGDRGISYGRIASWTEHADGTNTVVTELVDAEDDSVITAYRYVLVHNSYADGVTDPMFTYTVRSVEKIK